MTPAPRNAAAESPGRWPAGWTAAALCGVVLVAGCEPDFLVGREGSATGGPDAPSEGAGGATGAGGSAAEAGRGGEAAAGSSVSSGSGIASAAGHGGPASGVVIPMGARPSFDTLSFAVVGATAPPGADDVVSYPVATITGIWKAVEAASPWPWFAITTGDYLNAASPAAAGQQMATYLGAEALYAGQVFHAQGVGEASPPGSDAFFSSMLAPIGVTQPWFVVTMGSPSPEWTAKVVFISDGSWWTAQEAAWLTTTLAQTTTYTFVVRNEPSEPAVFGETESDAILAASPRPVTLVITGHRHTFAYAAYRKQVIVGNGGALPVEGLYGPGYVIARQRPDGSMLFTEYDAATSTEHVQFAVHADGTPL